MPEEVYRQREGIERRESQLGKDKEYDALVNSPIR